MSDLISRQAAIDAAWFLHADDRDALRDTLRKLPSVSPVKHGKWIYRNLGGWHCSLCDEQAPFWCMASTQNLSNYCPNCGHPMESGEDE